jgi:hypothetical protein
MGTKMGTMADIKNFAHDKRNTVAGAIRVALQN